MTRYHGIEIKPLADKWRSVYPRLPIGTVVHLNSGSPLMVIVDYETAFGGYVCARACTGSERDAEEQNFSADRLVVVKMGKKG